MYQLGNSLIELLRQLLCPHAAFFKNRGNGKWICNGRADMTGETITAIFSPVVYWCRRKPSQLPSTNVYLFTHFVRWKSQNTWIFTLWHDFLLRFWIQVFRQCRSVTYGTQNIAKPHANARRSTHSNWSLRSFCFRHYLARMSLGTTDREVLSKSRAQITRHRHIRTCQKIMTLFFPRQIKSTCQPDIQNLSTCAFRYSDVRRWCLLLNSESRAYQVKQLSPMPRKLCPDLGYDD